MRTQTTQKSILKAILLLVLASLLLAGCAGVGANTWPALTTADNSIYMAQMQIKKVDGTSGAENWVYPDKVDAANVFFGTPALANGWVIAGNYGHVVVALDENNGSLIWSNEDQKGKGRFIAGPVVAGEQVLIPSTDQYLYALDLNTGKQLWKFKADGPLWAAVAVDDKAAYLASMDHSLYAINLATGQKLWDLKLDAPMVATPVLDDQGILYLTTFNEEAVAVDTASHRVVWRVPITGRVWNPVLLHDGVLYFGTDANKIYALSADSGKTVWSQTADATTETTAVTATPVVLGDSVAFTTEAGEVFTVSAAGTRGWTRTLKGKLYTNPVVVNNLMVVSGLEMDHYLATFDAQGKQDWTYDPPKK